MSSPSQLFLVVHDEGLWARGQTTSDGGSTCSCDVSGNSNMSLNIELKKRGETDKQIKEVLRHRGREREETDGERDVGRERI